MNKVNSIEQIVELVSKIRNLRKGFLTNFYLDSFKHDIWIKNNSLFFEEYGETLFFIKHNNGFWNIFYTTSNIEELNNALNILIQIYSSQLMITDIIGNDEQCLLINDCFKRNSFQHYNNLVRMSKLTQEILEFSPNHNVSYANIDDANIVLSILNRYFDPLCEQIPYIEELYQFAKDNKILLYKENEQILGFVIYEMNKSTLYLRYWFVHPDHRDKKIGSTLLNHFFYEGRQTRRQLFWVLSENENAIKRYRHFGYSEEKMYDYVLIKNKKI